MLHVFSDRKPKEMRRMLTHHRPVMPFGNRKFYFMSYIKYRHILKNITPLETLKYLGNSQSLKLRILIEVILSISLKLNFTSYTLGGLSNCL